MAVITFCVGVSVLIVLSIRKYGRRAHTKLQTEDGEIQVQKLGRHSIADTHL